VTILIVKRARVGTIYLHNLTTERSRPTHISSIKKDPSVFQFPKTVAKFEYFGNTVINQVIVFWVVTQCGVW